MSTRPARSMINILRAIYAEAYSIPQFGPRSRIDPDLDAEAGMDGNYQRLLQAARNLDARERDPSPPSWCTFSIGFSCDGSDGDTVAYVLDRLGGCTVNAGGRDVSVVRVEQDEREPYPCYLVGVPTDEAGEPIPDEGEIRVPLDGAHILVY